MIQHASCRAIIPFFYVQGREALVCMLGVQSPITYGVVKNYHTPDNVATYKFKISSYFLKTAVPCKVSY